MVHIVFGCTDCRGSTTVTSGNIEEFKDCTIIEGSITILDQTFAGFQEVYPKYVFLSDRSTIFSKKCHIIICSLNI